MSYGRMRTRINEVAESKEFARARRIAANSAAAFLIFGGAGITGALLTGNPIFLSAITTGLLPTACVTAFVMRQVEPQAVPKDPMLDNTFSKTFATHAVINGLVGYGTNLALKVVTSHPISIFNQLLLSTIGSAVVAGAMHLRRYLRDTNIPPPPAPEVLAQARTSPRVF